MGDRNPWELSVEPRAWQQAAFDAWVVDCRGIVSVVTGGGKTLLAFMCMTALRHRHEDQRFNIVVPTTALLDQWFVSLLEDLHVDESSIAIYSGAGRPHSPRQVNLFVLNTAREHAPRVSQAGPYALIVDECHRTGSPCNAQALGGTYNATLGLSATPERAYDDGFGRFIEPKLGPIVFEYTYENAYQDRVICPFNLINVEVPFLRAEEEKYSRLTRRAAIELRKLRQGEGSEDALKFILQRRAAVSAQAAQRVPVTCRLVEEHRGSRLIVFHERVADAQIIAKTLRARGHSVTEYHTGIAPAIRRHNLALYRRGVFDVLLCCRALDEGMNVPETSVAVIASSTSTARQRIQRLGVGTRQVVS